MKRGKHMSTAANEGYLVLTDNDLIRAAETRVRQLEEEYASNQIYLAEAKTDPHDTASEEVHTKNIETLEARLKVTRARLTALRANISKDESGEPTE